jgi:hypothetical protein
MSMLNVRLNITNIDNNNLKEIAEPLNLEVDQNCYHDFETSVRSARTLKHV